MALFWRSGSLLKCAKTGNLSKVEELLSRGARTTDVDESGWSAIHHAAWNGHNNIVTCLLAAGVPCNARTSHEQRTPLYLATLAGHARCVQTLLHAGAEVGFSDNEGYTAVHAAATSGQAQITRLLIQSTATLLVIDCQDKKSGRTALHWAAFKGHVDCVRVLLELGADKEIRDMKGQLAADIACGDPTVATSKELVLQQLIRSSQNHHLSPHPPPKAPDPSPTSLLGGAASPTPQRMLLPQGHPGISSYEQYPLQQQQMRQTKITTSSEFGPSAPITPGTSDHGGNILDTFMSLPDGSFQTAQQVGMQQDRLMPGAAVQHVGVMRPGGNQASMNSLQGASFAYAASDDAASQISGLSASVQGSRAFLSHHQLVGQHAWSDTVATAQVEGQSESLASWEGRGTGILGTRPAEGLLSAVAPLLPSVEASTAAKFLQQSAVAVVRGTTALLAGNPCCVIEAVFSLAKLVLQSCEDAAYCRYKTGRLRDRLQALIPALHRLNDWLRVQPITQDPTFIKSIDETLRVLHQVLSDLLGLLQSISYKQPDLLQRTILFLKARGYRERFEVVDAELQGIMMQLLLILQIARIPMEQVQQDLISWPKQNVDDRQNDLKELEMLMLQHLCGVRDQLSNAVNKLEQLLIGNHHDLQQVALLMDQMNASRECISTHLRQLNDKVDEVASLAKSILTYFKTSAKNRQLREQPPPFIIPKSAIKFLDDEVSEESWGGYGTVVEARRDVFGKVAVKTFNIKSLGDLDLTAAVTEALKLSRVNHHNVVKCYGILSDDDNIRDKESKSGSLVMEWVEGGNVYKWLQSKGEQVGLAVRVAIAIQVAAGMRHLHHQRLVHGDIKPHNVLVGRTIDETPLDDDALVPEVKICDFGLAKYNSTTMMSATHGTALSVMGRSYSRLYTSPERLRTGRRSFQDDMYAFGMLMYFLATNYEPFHDIDAAAQEASVLSGSRPSLDEWVAKQQGKEWETLARNYSDLAQACWHQDPTCRPQEGFDAIYGELCLMLWPSDK